MMDRISTQVRRDLMMQSPGWKKLAARMVWNHYSDLSWVLRTSDRGGSPAARPASRGCAGR
jgi:hypothetical protein